jgi:hypothetical protein
MSIEGLGSTALALWFALWAALMRHVLYSTQCRRRAAAVTARPEDQLG